MAGMQKRHFLPSTIARSPFPAIDNSEVPCIEEQAVADLGSLQSVSTVALPARESSDMRKLMMHANPITTASQLLSRIKQAPMADNQVSSSPAAGLHDVHYRRSSYMLLVRLTGPTVHNPRI